MYYIYRCKKSNNILWGVIDNLYYIALLLLYRNKNSNNILWGLVDRLYCIALFITDEIN